MKIFVYSAVLLSLLNVLSAGSSERSGRKFKRQSYGAQLPATPTAPQYGATNYAPAGGAPVGGYRSQAPAPVYGSGSSSTSSGGSFQSRIVASGGNVATGGYGARPGSGGQQASAPSVSYGGNTGGSGQYGGGQSGGSGHGGQYQDYDDGANPLPGVAGQDYPTYGPHPPQTNFNCLSAPHVPGYYANPDFQCQVFHICEAGGKISTFLCPNGTIFNQKYFVCDWWYNVNCGEATNYYGINGNLYQVPEGGYGGRTTSGGGGQQAAGQGGYGTGGAQGSYGASGAQGGYSTGAGQGPSNVQQQNYGSAGGVRPQSNQYSFAPSSGTVGY